MLIYLQLLSKDDETISYEYGTKKDVMSGKIVMPIKEPENAQFVSYDSCVEKINIYATRAYSKMCKYVREDHFPQTDFYACG